MENALKYVFITFLLFLTALQAQVADANVTAEPKIEQILTLQQLQDINATTKAHVPTFYKDYDWDIGIVGGMTFDGVQTDTKRTTIGAGIRGSYHLTEYVGLGLEYINYFNTFSSDPAVENANSQMVLGSITFDFSAERPYSLYAIGSLGYEYLFKDITGAQHNPVLLLGFGFRYMLADRWSANIEGRMKARLRDMSSSTGDYGLMGTVGLNYHFGLSDDKSKLIDAVDKHNAPLEPNK